MKSIIVSPEYFRKRGGVVIFTPPKRKKTASQTVIIEHYAPYVTSGLAKLIKKLDYFAFVLKERFYDGTACYTVFVSKNRSMVVSLDTDHDWEPTVNQYSKAYRYASYSCWPQEQFYIASDIYNNEISVHDKDQFKCAFSRDNSQIIFKDNKTDTSAIDLIELSIRVFERVID